MPRRTAEPGRPRTGRRLAGGVVPDGAGGVADGRPDDTPAARLGAAIREQRRTRGLTLVQLATSTGLSHSFLSQVERGRARPSMKSLFDIAGALGTTQDRLLAHPADDADTPAVVVLRAGEGMRLGPVDTGDTVDRGAARPLIAHPGFFYPTEFVDISRSYTDFWYQHEGSEFAYVAVGSIEIELGDGGVHRLGPGDSMRYPGHVPHRWRQLGAAASRVLMVHSGVHVDPTRR